jgi:transposase, IS5 family
MYSHDSRQFSFSEFLLPFEGKLEAKNRWVQLSAMVPWQRFEKQYAALFSPAKGSPAKPFRMAFGALILKERLNCSDEELVEQIRENPYLQYFLGLEEFSNEAPFEASMMVHFRKRISLEMIGKVNESLVAGLRSHDNPPSDDEPPGANFSVSAKKPETEDSASTNNTDNNGRLILDATCTPADITYPTDSKLLNEAREKSENLVDVLYTQSSKTKAKPRTYRKIARKKWLSFSKKRRHTHAQIRKINRALLGYLGRNLKHLDKQIDQVGLQTLSRAQYKNLLVIREVYRQQKEMFEQRTQRVDARIVSLSQPHVRPIVRGKAGAKVEFGAKLSASLDDGYFFLDRLDWNNFNESKHLIPQVETYHQRRGYYPTSVHVDKIYRTKENREWCKEKNIRLSGPKLGRPLKNTTQNKEQILKNKALARQDEIDRIPIEGKFGQSKRRFGLDRVMTKLAITSQCVIAMTFLVINLEKGLRFLFLSLFCMMQPCIKTLKNILKRYSRKNITLCAA